MARSPTRRARLTNPPATPPAIAAAFGDVLVDSGPVAVIGDVLVDSGPVAAFGDVLVDSGIIETVDSVVWPLPASGDMLLQTEVGVVDVTEPRELLVKEDLILEPDGMVDAGDEAKIYERKVEVRFSGGQLSGHSSISPWQQLWYCGVLSSHVVLSLR